MSDTHAARTLSCLGDIRGEFRPPIEERGELCGEFLEALEEAEEEEVDEGPESEEGGEIDGMVGMGGEEAERESVSGEEERETRPTVAANRARGFPEVVRSLSPGGEEPGRGSLR